mgnify:CR=1 FL=1
MWYISCYIPWNGRSIENLPYFLYLLLQGFDEFIDINLAELPDLVSAFALVINAHKGGK